MKGAQELAGQRAWVVPGEGQLKQQRTGGRLPLLLLPLLLLHLNVGQTAVQAEPIASLAGEVVVACRVWGMGGTGEGMRSVLIWHACMEGSSNSQRVLLSAQALHALALARFVGCFDGPRAFAAPALTPLSTCGATCSLGILMGGLLLLLRRQLFLLLPSSPSSS